MALTARQELFCLEYLKDLNATQAAIRAGYAPASADVEGSRLLGNAGVQEKVSALKAERAEGVKVDAAFVLRELIALASVDISAAFDEDGKLKNIHDIPLDVRKAIAGVDVTEEFAGRGENREHVGYTKKLKFWDRTKALEMIGRHIQLFKDSLALTGADGSPLQIDDSTRISRLEALVAAVEHRQQETGTDLV